MKVRIVVPGGAAAPTSGGALYDLELARALRAQGHDAQVAEEPAHDAVNLFDGLGAPRWAWRLGEVGGEKVALIHQPVSALRADASRVEAERALLAGCAAVQFVSERAKAGAVEQYGGVTRCWVAPPGADHFTPRPPRVERRLVGNGHLWEGKGVLEALELVAGLDGEWHLDWLGALDVDVDYTARVRAALRRLNLGSRVTFHGRVAMGEVAEHLARASAFLSSSRYESWGLALAESLRAGVPIVGNTPAGVLDFVQSRGARGGALRAWLTQLLAGDAAALREEASTAGAELPTWAACAAITAHHLELL